MRSLSYLPGADEIIRRALAEDVGAGDITTMLTVPVGLQAEGALVARASGVVAGIAVAARVFHEVDPDLTITELVEDGEAVEPGASLMVVSGAARSILTGERVALNFLQHLSGIATRTAHLVALAAGYKARVVDTRKTTPGLRTLEKYAVRAGGGYNHRLGLYDAVLIKDNHIAASGSISEAVRAAFAGAPHTMTVTVECDTLEQVREALEAGVDIVLVDNMTPELIAQAVEIADGQAAVEASGGVTEETLAAIARAGVDVISVGALTHSVTALDIGLDLRRL